MSEMWNDGDDVITLEGVTLMGWCRFALRALVLILLILVCLTLLLLLRLIEKPVFGEGRPWTPHITQFVCRNAFRIMRMGYVVKGELMTQRGAVVANHSSWMDVFALNAAKRVYFVSKAEVAKWPGIGALAKANGTIFIERNPRKAKEQTEVFEERLKAGHKLLFFPEGTSTDGMRVLPFKTTLFASFFTQDLRDIVWVQPVSVNYYAPDSEERRFYGWWGDMEFGTHLVRTLAVRRPGRVEVVFHAPRKISEYGNRKILAKALEEDVRAGHHSAAA